MASLKKWLDKRRNPWKGVFYDAFKAWKRENGQARLLDYDHLPKGAVVLDIGGFRGEWTDLVLKAQPDCNVHIFEPHPQFAEALRAKFHDDQRVTVHEFALGSSTGSMQLSDAEDGSSAIADHGRQFDVSVVSVDTFFEEHPVDQLDLIKINIEGGEYDLLPALAAHPVIAKVQRLQVQFHLFEPSLAAARDTIRGMLVQTHDCAWCYPFVWEEWRRKGE